MTMDRNGNMRPEGARRVEETQRAEEVGHTPGPWQGKHSHGYLDIPIEGQGRYVCTVAARGVFEDGSGYANARLIAAAPDLLAALVECEQYLVQRGIERRGIIGRTKVLPAIRAAIAKARGA